MQRCMCVCLLLGSASGKCIAVEHQRASFDSSVALAHIGAFFTKSLSMWIFGILLVSSAVLG